MNHTYPDDNFKETLSKKIANRDIVAGVIGLGYVGLPLAVETAKAGFKTIGFDVKKDKVDSVNKGLNYIGGCSGRRPEKARRTRHACRHNRFQ